MRRITVMLKKTVRGKVFPILLLTGMLWAKTKPEPTMVILWPNSQTPTLRLTFGKFAQVGGYAGQISFVSDVLIENLSKKSLTRGSFTVYLLDKNRVRIGDGVLHISDLDPDQQVKIAFQFNSVGIPASLDLVANNDSSGMPTSLKTVSLRVVSVPPGASLKVDGHDSGMTPVMVALKIGVHTLEVSKEGYASSKTPVDITSEDLSGGSVTIELGGISRDTVELRDGTVVLGDVISVSMTSVIVRIDGTDKAYGRNQVKRIILVEREVAPQPFPPAPSNISQH